MMSESNITPEIEQKFEKSDAIQEKVERLIGSLKPGFSVTVYRERPSWAKGYLERLDIGEDDGIDLQYLADQWGGEVLRLRVCDPTGTYRGGADIPFASYPPRHRGRIITRRRGEDWDDLPQGARLGEPPALQQPQNNGNSIDAIFSMISRLRKEDLSTVRQLLESTKTDVPAVQNGLTSVVQMAHQFKELQGIFGGAEQQLSNSGTGGDNSALFATLAEVAKAILAPKATNTAIPVHRSDSLPRPIPPNPNLVRSPIAQFPGSSNPNHSGFSLAGALADMDPDDVADCALAALSRMSPEKKERAIGAVLSRLGESEDVDYEDGEPESINDSTSDTEQDYNQR